MAESTSTVTDVMSPDAPTADTLLDREMIKEAMARYCRGVDRLDAEMMIRSAYHPDAFDDHGPFKGLRDDFIDWVIPWCREQYLNTSHHLTTQSIVIKGDVAHVETYCYVTQERAVGDKREELVGQGRYVDRFEKRNGDWRVAHRILLLDSMRTDHIAPWSGKSPISVFNVGARDRTDPVFAARPFGE